MRITPLQGHTAAISPRIITGLMRALIPHHDGEPGIRSSAIGPGVEAQTVLADVGCIVPWADRTKRGSFQCLVPSFARLWWLPPGLIAGISSVENVQGCCHVGLRDPKGFLQILLVEVLISREGTVRCLNDHVPKLSLGNCSCYSLGTRGPL